MGKFLPELWGKEKTRVCRHTPQPLRGMRRLQRMIKRSIDFDRVEKFRQVSCLMKAARSRRRIHHAVPILISPPGWPHEEARMLSSNARFFDCHARSAHKTASSV